MLIACLAIALLANFVVHEAAHAVAMSHRGIAVAEAGVGIGPVLVTWQPHRLNYPLKLRLVPIAAYVWPAEGTEAKLRQLSYRDRAVCYGAGIAANLLLTLLTFAAAVAYSMLAGSASLGPRLEMLAVCFVLVAALWWGRRLFCAYILPFMGIVALVYLIWSTVDDFRASVSGPISLFMIGHTPGTTSLDMSSLSIVGAGTLAFMLVGSGLALINSLPILGLDGGHVAEAALGRWLKRRVLIAWRVVGGTLLVGLIALGLTNDVLNLLSQL